MRNWNLFRTIHFLDQQNHVNDVLQNHDMLVNMGETRKPQLHTPEAYHEEYEFQLGSHTLASSNENYF